MNDPRHLSSADFDVDVETNTSSNPTFESLIEGALSRRKFLIGGMSATAAAFASTVGAAELTCLFGVKVNPTLELGFNPVAKNLDDLVTVPEGYTATVVYALGDPIDASTPAWAGNGSESGASFEHRAGDHHDGMYYFGLGPDRKRGYSNRNGLLCINHENITQPFLHANGATVGTGGVRLVEDEVIKEMNAHGVSVVEIKRGLSLSAKFAVVRGSTFNRRITTFTPMIMSGPAAGAQQFVTKYSPDGTRTRGTVNNCANGYTPWGTYLTCEENWAFYFRRDSGDDVARSPREVTSLKRYGISQGAAGNYGWTTVAVSDPQDTRFSRWNTTVSGASAADDFRNAANTFGWVVEIDPYDPTSTPRKRTALGRFGHEGAWPAKFTVGKPVVFYMGDDSRNEYIYKYVSEAKYSLKDKGLAAGDKYLDEGTLYVAKFAGDGTGQWIALKLNQNGLTDTATPYAFTSRVDILVNARLAADAVGATKMDRPEWAATNTLNGEVYFTLTNNSQRGVGTGPAVDAANPRSYTDVKAGTINQGGNVNGHIIRLREAGDEASATSFTWDVYLFGSEAGANASTVNVSGLTADNDFSSPDGLWFARPQGCADGLLWIETDDGAYTDVTNCMLLAGVPGSVGDGAVTTIGGVSSPVGQPATANNLRRFLVGPKGCELTGLDSTPDGKVLFVNIQHPGENTPAAQIGNPAAYESHWPDGGLARPRSATLAITRNDGGTVGIKS